MTLASSIRDFVPPIVLRGMSSLRRRLLNGRQPISVDELPEWEYAPDGWRAVDQAQIGGWDQPGVAETYASKWRQFLERVAGTAALGVNHEASVLSNDCVASHNHMMTLGYVVGSLAHQRDRLSILDFGGALGHNLPVLKALFPRVNFEYSCREVSRVCEQGEKLNPDVRFFRDDSWQSSLFDLVIASNSLQYLPEWKDGISRLAGAARLALWITKVPVVQESASFVILQRAYAYGYRTEYLGWCLNKEEFLTAAKAAKLRLLREFLVAGHNPRVPDAPASIRSMGFLFHSDGEREA